MPILWQLSTVYLILHALGLSLRCVDINKRSGRCTNRDAEYQAQFTGCSCLVLGERSRVVFGADRITERRPRWWQQCQHQSIALPHAASQDALDSLSGPAEPVDSLCFATAHPHVKLNKP